MDQMGYLKILADAQAGVPTIRYELREDSEFTFKLEDELETYGYEVVEEDIQTVRNEDGGPDVEVITLTWEKILDD